MKVSCIVPAYNEARTIAGVLKAVQVAKERGIIFDIIVVSDGSTDSTAAIARANGADKIVVLEKNLGKGRAIFEGLPYAAGELILFLDADLVGLTAEHIESIVAPVVLGETQMSVGYLAADAGQNILPYLSGQRCVRRGIFRRFTKQEFEKSKYCFELMLNREAGYLGWKTLFVPLEGLTHVHKREKYGLRRSIAKKLDFSAGILWFYRRAIVTAAVFSAVWVGYFLFLYPSKVHGLALGSIAQAGVEDTVLVVVAHPDDEVVGAGGYIREAVKRGATVWIVVVTNGDANRWSAMMRNKKLIPNEDSFAAEGRARMIESKRALALLGVPGERVIFMGFPDRNLYALFSHNWSEPKTSSYTGWSENRYNGTYRTGIPYTGEVLTAMLSDIMLTTKPTIIITHHPEDKNSDHRATYGFLRKALEGGIRDMIGEPKVYSFLIHSDINSYPKPFAFRPAEGLYPPAKLQSSCSWQIFPLPYGTELLKQSALKQFKSQMTNPYLSLLLRAFVRTNELFCEVKP